MPEVSLQEQFELPLVKDLIEEVDSFRSRANLTTKIPDSQIEDITVPYRIKNKLLMQAGTFNEITYPVEELKIKVDEANEKGLMLDHKDTQNEGVTAWVGRIENTNWQTNGSQGEGMYGDLVILDKPVAQKLASGAKWGISPTIDYEKNNVGEEVIGTDLLWKSFSFVIEPAVRATMLNNKKGDTMPEEKDKKKKLPYKYPSKEGEKELQVEENVLAVLKEKDSELQELKKFKDTIENSKKEELVSNLTSTEFLIGRIDESELQDRKKTLMSKSSEILSELVEVVGEHAELSAYTAFVKKYVKDHKGASIKEAAAAWKKGKGKLSETPSVETVEPEAAEPEKEEPNPETGEASLTAPEATKKRAELSEIQIKDVDKGMHAFMSACVPGGAK